MKKRLVIFCDGTWNEPNEPGSPTNVVKCLRAVKPLDSRDVAQISFYIQGVGTGDPFDRLLGGACGLGLSEHVKRAYGFIVDNYLPGDDIYLFGFSRGAFTARSLAGFIGTVGLLPKGSMEHFPAAWEVYRIDDGARRRETAAALAAELKSRTEVGIRFIGVWDTVGALGIPGGILRGPLLSAFSKAKYGFHSVNLGAHVDSAYQALAIDEHRQAFLPAIWARPDDAPATQRLEQVWFVGAHSNIGGGYRICGLSDQACRWLLAKASREELEFDDAYIASHLAPADGDPVDSREGIYRLWPPVARTVCATPTERIHRSALQKFQSEGYRPPSITELEVRLASEGRSLIDLVVD